ncbi:ankyrin repeat domain-containing protein [Tumidithrix elongata RA019]|uniref:Ankyrin repeat domain-containing protein n=1 Tax=Tumidithrix elongata BACA0141 TaxID=2716417 RepID=A0AAW9PQB6_9CYAN|nr:ankyrin repeat domain-containing protein [Tumidithrix elongata RA019]
MKTHYFNLDSPLHRSAFFGDTEGLSYLLELGADINSTISLSLDEYPFFHRLTPLMLAAWSTAGATVDTLRWLIEHGANPYIKSKAEVTAARYAMLNPSWWKDPEQRTKADRSDRLQYLLSLGIDPMETAWNDSTLLTEACTLGDSNCVALLLNAHASANPVISENEANVSSSQIPLFCAAKSGSAECVRLLLQAGAEVNTRDTRKSTALMYAKNVDVAQTLLDGGIDLYAKYELDDMRFDALDCILHNNHEDSDFEEFSKIVAYLIHAGLDIEKKDDRGNTRLWDAAFSGNEAAINCLLEHGANPHAKSHQGSSPLHAVCWSTDRPFLSDWQPWQTEIRIIERLLVAKIDINVRDDMSWTPIHEAVFGDGGYLTALKTLLKHGADPNALTHNGITPLMLAAMEGELECMQTLLSAGADLTRKDSKGLTAADYAIEHYEKLLTEGNTRYEGSLDYLLQRASECIWLLK